MPDQDHVDENHLNSDLLEDELRSDEPHPSAYLHTTQDLNPLHSHYRQSYENRESYRTN